MASESNYDVVVAGAGPAGIAAACSAARYARGVALIDDNPAPGGQIWRGEADHPMSRTSGRWLSRLAASPIELISGARVIGLPEARVLLIETHSKVRALAFGKLILATGARERFLPFPGWTLPNVVGAGGLLALAKGSLPVAGKRVVVAGTGPLLVAAAAGLRRLGATVPLIAEQASLRLVASFAASLTTGPRKLLEGARFTWRLRGVRYLTGCWPVAATGDNCVRAVTLRRGARVWEEPCDYLACGFGLVPNLELARLLGCTVRPGGVQVDDWQQTDVIGVYAAGEVTGTGGLELALIEGRIAGLAAVGRKDEARRLFWARRRGRRLQAALEENFSLRGELRELAQPETIVCRCEDIELGKLAGHRSWRSAKLYTRCGMGPCQGRVCGPAAEFLFGWQADSVRPPVFPANVSSLCLPDRSS